MTAELEGMLQTMCNWSQAIEERGIEKASKKALNKKGLMALEECLRLVPPIPLLYSLRKRLMKMEELDRNPNGTVNNKITCGEDGLIQSVDYMTESDGEEFFGDN